MSTHYYEHLASAVVSPPQPHTSLPNIIAFKRISHFLLQNEPVSSLTPSILAAGKLNLDKAEFTEDICNAFTWFITENHLAKEHNSLKHQKPVESSS